MTAPSAPVSVPAGSAVEARPYHQHHERFKAGVRAAVTWLHREAGRMNDPKARDILNSAALGLGSEMAFRPREVESPEARVPELPN